MSFKVLLVDDDPAVLDGYARLLARRYDVSTASSAAEALQRLAREGPFGVVVSDFDMPGTSGVELLSRVRELWPTVARLMLTGVGERDVAIQAFERGGALRFLDKPVGLADFERALENAVLEHERLCRSLEETDRLVFSRDTLRGFLERLEGRIDRHSSALGRLRAFAHELSSATGLTAVAECAANAASDLMSGRGIFVELIDVFGDSARFQAFSGPELGEARHREEIRSRDGSIGSLQVDRRGLDGSPLSDSERNILASIAASTAVAVHNQIRRHERDEAQLATILALASLAEHRDNETGRHLERVSRYCELVATSLRERGLYTDVITDEWIRDLYRSAPLHDIGKVGVPDGILLKPGKLDPDEWEIMMTHTTIGADTLKSVMGQKRRSTFLQMSLDIAWCHHEKWDGSGYPRALRGLEIPLSARILALADVYDALTTVRPYKQAWTHADAFKLIEDGAGKHFDPDVVAAFAERRDRADEIRALLADEA